MRIHLLGICGTFMSGCAIIAQQLGHQVSGSDENIYPPMSSVLEQNRIQFYESYCTKNLQPHPDLIIIGNAIKRGTEAVEYILEKNLPYISAPQWLYENVLRHRHVLAVSGTHGKTTIASMLAWILHNSGIEPGYLIGGVPRNDIHNANLGKSPYFVIEADEYDCAFFDKRSKFIHYHPRTLIINNLEFDHSDIFPNLQAIQNQFHYLVRTMPQSAKIIYHQRYSNIVNMLQKGYWCSLCPIGDENNQWHAKSLNHDHSEFMILNKNKPIGQIQWGLFGWHNIENALSAFVAADSIGISHEKIIQALFDFQGVKRRLELKEKINGISIYDDFAHHPTAIEMTINSLRRHVGGERIVVILEFASNTMAAGEHRENLLKSLSHADCIYFLRPEQWSIQPLLDELNGRGHTFDTVEEIVEKASQQFKSRDHILIMSNKSFAGLQQKLIQRIKANKEIIHE